MEGDATFSPRGLTSGDFNPRPPWGGRLSVNDRLPEDEQFQSTPSVGRATLRAEQGGRQAPRHFNPRPPWGGRRRGMSTALWCRYFNPRPPWGGRRRNKRLLQSALSFQSTPSVGRATTMTPDELARLKFQSTPSVGRATMNENKNTKVEHKFQSTPSVGRATFLFSESI